METLVESPAYKFINTAADEKPDTEETRLLEQAMASQPLTRTEKNRIAEILYGICGAGSHTYKLAGWAWPMYRCLPRFLVCSYDHWQAYYAPDKTSLRAAFPGRIDEIVSA